MNLKKQIDIIQQEIDKKPESIAKRLEVKQTSDKQFEMYFLSPDGLAGAVRHFAANQVSDAIEAVRNFN